jgi:hypothetical protein
MPPSWFPPERITGITAEVLKNPVAVMQYLWGSDENLIRRCTKNRSMNQNSLFGLLFSLFLVISVFFTGCSDESPPAETVTPTPAHPDAKYGEGDIITMTSSSAASSLYLIILKYDAAADAYTRAIIEKNADGTWGHRSSNRTEKISRVQVEKVYPVRVGHVAVSSVPIITPTVPSVITTQAISGKAPSITKISPTYASKDSAVTMMITGTNFEEGATVKLIRAGSVAIPATSVSVSAGSITCVFDLNGKSDGSYSLFLINPDGQSDSQMGIFTIGEASPIISSLNPITAGLNDTVPLAIYGQNFRTNIKVSFTKGTEELVCMNPISLDSMKISCNLDLDMAQGASLGDWTVTVLNIDSQKKGTWAKKFTITNITTED